MERTIGIIYCILACLFHINELGSHLKRKIAELFVFIILQIFLHKAAFWETFNFLKAFKRHSNSAICD